jgi:histidine triad (HIT) family protein
VRSPAGTRDGWIVHHDAGTVAFLDNRPLFPGHTLLIPATHVETLPELEKPLLGRLFEMAQRLCLAVEEAMEADGTFVAVNNKVSQSVPHLHVHIVPRRRKDGLKGFFWPRQKYPDNEAAVKVRDAIALRLSAGHA